MSDARRRKQAVCVRAGRGVVGRWVVKKVVSQVSEGVRPLVVVSWVEMRVVGLDIWVVSMVSMFIHGCSERATEVVLEVLGRRLWYTFRGRMALRSVTAWYC